MLTLEKIQDSIDKIGTLSKKVYFHIGNTNSKYYDKEYNFYHGFARVRLKGKYGYINEKREEICPIKYDDAYNFNFHQGFAVVRLKDKYGYINNKGEEITPIKYDNCKNCFNGFAVVKLNGKYGYINNKGEEITSIKYDDCFDFYNGIAIVKINDKYGYINEKGEEVIDMKYDFISSFHDDVAITKLNSKYGFINTKGEVIIDIKYDNITKFSNDIALARYDNYCFIKNDGTKINCTVDKIENIGSRDDILYIAYNKELNLVVFKTGCFFGDLKEFRQAVEKTHKCEWNKKYYDQYIEVIKRYEQYIK